MKQPSNISMDTLEALNQQLTELQDEFNALLAMQTFINRALIRLSDDEVRRVGTIFGAELVSDHVMSKGEELKQNLTSMREQYRRKCP